MAVKMLKGFSSDRGRSALTASAASPKGDWLERWLETVSDLARLKERHPMLDAVIDEIDGRMIRIGDHWLADFASCNYLGLDLDETVLQSVQPYLDRWGTHPSWSRLLGSPVIYEEIEAKLTELLGAEDVLALPTITHIHMSVISILAGAGTIFLDGRAHKTIYDGCQLARHHGAKVKKFRHDDTEHLQELLASDTSKTKLICMDGVNSMTGNAPDLRQFASIARDHGALLYVDDAHGFGVIGERGSRELCDYGMRGNGIVKHFGETYDNVVLVAGLSKSFSSLLAFIACPTQVKDMLKIAAPPYLYSGPSPVASLATTLAGLEVNEMRGDEIRADLHRKTKTVLSCLEKLGIATPNRSGFPIVEIPLADQQDVDDVGRYLFKRGIYATLAAYPLVPKNEVGFRIQITAANNNQQIAHLVTVLEEVADRFKLQNASRVARWYRG
jgi:8-amino-7-oxononanoate synthase